MSSKAISEIIVPAGAYERDLYWLLTEQWELRERAFNNHPYYSTLYPISPKQLSRIATLSCLFDTIVMPSADAPLPDFKTFLSGNDYYHPDLRIKMSFRKKENDNEVKKIVDYLMKSKNIQIELTSYSQNTQNDQQQLLLSRLIHQVRTAQEENATLLGDEQFIKFYNCMRDVMKSEIIEDDGFFPDIIPTLLSDNMTKLVGLDFSPENLNIFADIRGDKTISDYGESFRDAISESLNNDDPEKKLLELMKRAMDSASIAKRAKGAFTTVGSTANLAGCIPIVGNIASGVAVWSDVGERMMKKAEGDQQWYQLGSKIKEVSLDSMLKKV